MFTMKLSPPPGSPEIHVTPVSHDDYDYEYSIRSSNDFRFLFSSARKQDGRASGDQNSCENDRPLFFQALLDEGGLDNRDGFLSNHAPLKHQHGEVKETQSSWNLVNEVGKQKQNKMYLIFPMTGPGIALTYSSFSVASF
jgi:hypothetical protein